MSKLLDVIFFVFGPVILALGLLSFSAGGGPGRDGRGTAYYYFYDGGAMLIVAVGVGLFAFGTLRRHWKNRTKGDNKGDGGN